MALTRRVSWAHVEKTMRQHQHDLREPGQDKPVDDVGADSAVDVQQIALAADTGRIDAQAVVVGIREHRQAVQRLLTGGESLSGISRSLRLDRKTVRPIGSRTYPFWLMPRITSATISRGHGHRATARTGVPTEFGLRGEEGRRSVVW